jgi:hypothetical protein
VIKDGRHVLSTVAGGRIVPFPEQVKQGLIVGFVRVELNVYGLCMVPTIKKKLKMIQLLFVIIMVQTN